MGGMSSSFGGLGDAIEGVAEVAPYVADAAAVASGNPELAPDLWSTWRQLLYLLVPLLHHLH